jgi:hypothetical protein
MLNFDLNDLIISNILNNRITLSNELMGIPRQL